VSLRFSMRIKIGNLPSLIKTINKMLKTDILVIGSGIAGLTFAIKMARQRPDVEITVLTKTNERESNTLRNIEFCIIKT